jgi:hypothetical protein
MNENVRRHVRDRRLTPEEAAHYKAVRAQVEKDLPDLMAVGRALRDRQRGVPMQEAARKLKEERERQGLTLEQLVEKSGLDAAQVTRLENDANHDATVASLTRYAQALGKTLEIRLIENAATADS